MADISLGMCPSLKLASEATQTLFAAQLDHMMTILHDEKHANPEQTLQNLSAASLKQIPIMVQVLYCRKLKEPRVVSAEAFARQYISNFYVKFQGALSYWGPRLYKPEELDESEWFSEPLSPEFAEHLRKRLTESLGTSLDRAASQEMKSFRSENETMIRSWLNCKPNWSRHIIKWKKLIFVNRNLSEQQKTIEQRSTELKAVLTALKSETEAKKRLQLQRDSLATQVQVEAREVLNLTSSLLKSGREQEALRNSLAQRAKQYEKEMAAWKESTMS
ncbi:hypothetical protein N0V82_010113 [Gnomoniopsis sp. IMI 355080]|nr:hypothetical protein N0V82_010113 [Gnomoniopsis sp. IMI 355080]